jgi:hypothetical protein
MTDVPRVFRKFIVTAIDVMLVNSYSCYVRYDREIACMRDFAQVLDSNRNDALTPVEDYIAELPGVLLAPRKQRRRTHA